MKNTQFHLSDSSRKTYTHIALKKGLPQSLNLQYLLTSAVGLNKQQRAFKQLSLEGSEIRSFYASYYEFILQDILSNNFRIYVHFTTYCFTIQTSIFIIYIKHTFIQIMDFKLYLQICYLTNGYVEQLWNCLFYVFSKTLCVETQAITLLCLMDYDISKNHIYTVFCIAA